MQKCFRNLDEDSNLQPRILRDFPVNSLRNSRRSNLIEEGISQGTTYDNNILPNQNSVSLRNYKSFSPQETASRNLFFKNFLNKFPKFSDRREIFSQDRSANRYPLAHVLPSIFRSENVFMNPRNKYSSTLLDRNFENNIKDKKDSTNKMLDVYRADRDTEPLNSRYASSSNILPQRFSPKIENTFRSRRDPIPHIFDEKRNTIGKSSRAVPVNQQYSLTYPRKGYNSILPEIKRDSYVHPLENINTWKPTKNDGFFDNWDEKIKDSSQSLNVEQLKQAENNFLGMYPAKEQEVNTEDNNEQINKPYILPQNLDTQEQTDDGENFDDWDYAAYKNSQESAKINQLKETGNNWLQVFPAMERNTKYFENEKGTDKKFAEQENINQKYFEDEIVQDALETKQSKYNPYAFPQNMNNWGTIQDKELFDNLDFTHKDSPKTDQLEMYSEENNDKFFQNLKNKDRILESKTQASDDRNNRASVLNAYNTYILPRHLNILNDAKYSVDSSEIQKIPEVKNNILRANPMKERNEKFFVDEDIIENDAAIQDLILSKDIFDMDEYSSHNIDKKNTRDNTQVLTRIDPDLLDDIEDLPLEPTESTSMESFAELSTPK